jgi:hypothetical protein
LSVASSSFWNRPDVSQSILLHRTVSVSEEKHSESAHARTRSSGRGSDANTHAVQNGGGGVSVVRHYIESITKYLGLVELSSISGKEHVDQELNKR